MINQADYIPKVAYQYELFQNQEAYLGSDFPFSLTDQEYSQGCCPVAEEILETAIKIPMNEFYSPEDIDDIIGAIRKVAAYYCRK